METGLFHLRNWCQGLRGWSGPRGGGSCTASPEEITINYHEVDKLRIKSLSHLICQVDSSSEAFQAAAQGAFDNFYRWGVTAKGCMVDDHDVPCDMDPNISAPVECSDEANPVVLEPLMAAGAPWNLPTVKKLQNSTWRGVVDACRC